jgi:GNAT superfamily N-acetyltransferase
MTLEMLKEPTVDTKTDAALTIRSSDSRDFDAIYDLFQIILQEGRTYSYLPEEMTRDRSRQYWMDAPATHCRIAEVDGVFAGCYALRPNRTGRAGHVANASYMVHPDFRGRGIGRALGAHSLQLAKKLGYEAIQFNFVVSVNDVAVSLWQSLGFNIVGTMPKGFQYPGGDLVDVYMMHRFL